MLLCLRYVLHFLVQSIVVLIPVSLSLTFMYIVVLVKSVGCPEVVHCAEV
jgi:hypothetical protein